MFLLVFCISSIVHHKWVLLNNLESLTEFYTQMCPSAVLKMIRLEPLCVCSGELTSKPYLLVADER